MKLRCSVPEVSVIKKSIKCKWQNYLYSNNLSYGMAGVDTVGNLGVRTEIIAG